MNERYRAVWQAAYDEIQPGDAEMRANIAHAIAAAVEVGLSWAEFDPPSESRPVQRCMAVGDDYLPEDIPDHLSWGVAAHEWDDRIEREL